MKTGGDVCTIAGTRNVPFPDRQGISQALLAFLFPKSKKFFVRFSRWLSVHDKKPGKIPGLFVHLNRNDAYLVDTWKAYQAPDCNRCRRQRPAPFGRAALHKCQTACKTRFAGGLKKTHPYPFLNPLFGG
jgi:hypothetical protein